MIFTPIPIGPPMTKAQFELLCKELEQYQKENPPQPLQLTFYSKEAYDYFHEVLDKTYLT